MEVYKHDAMRDTKVWKILRKSLPLISIIEEVKPPQKSKDVYYCLDRWVNDENRETRKCYLLV